MDAVCDVPASGIAPIVVDQVATGQGAVIAIAESDRAVAEPRVVMRVRVPEMQMGIGD